MTIWTGLALQNHPATSDVLPGVTVSVELQRRAHRFDVIYRLAEALDVLQVPASKSGIRTDGLWRHTCCELFLGQADGAEYVELNASPGSDWALYHFSACRVVGQTLSTAAPVINRQWVNRDLVMSVSVSTSEWCLPWLSDPLRVGLSVVLEGTDGALAYHALEHVREVPDFHDRRAWRLMPALQATGGLS